MKAFILGILLMTASLSWAGPAVLFEEVEVPGIPKESFTKPSSEKSQPSSSTPLYHRGRSGPASEITPLSQRHSLRETYQGQEFEFAEDLRGRRRVGVGAMTAGNAGLFGAFIELNLTPLQSVLTGFGGGPGYSSLSFQWKHLIGGRDLTPYFGFGYARWYNASGGASMDQTMPSNLGARILTKEERESGKFAIDFLSPMIGLQYTFLHGDYVGVGLFAEIDLLTPARDLKPSPTGSLGTLYYF